MKPVISDETLHAFVDGELDVAESERLIARMRDDKDLAQRVCALRSLQTMVRLAYVEPPVPDGRKLSATPRRRFMQRCAFACLAVFVGLSAGWTLRGAEPQAVANVPAAMPDGYQMVSLKHAADPNRVLLHIDSAAPGKMKAVLDQAEYFLEAADRQGRAVQLEILANSRGLDLLLADHSPYAARMARMKQRYGNNLHWVACGQSVARLRSDGEKVVLLPATQTAPTAIKEIVTRLQQGWTYVRV
jgi:intracellular sulfur oxidation DsrE/DsrF family protein